LGDPASRPASGGPWDMEVQQTTTYRGREISLFILDNNFDVFFRNGEAAALCQNMTVCFLSLLQRCT
jgi:hypothetical protein